MFGERAQRVRFTFGNGMHLACDRDCSRAFSTFVEKDLTTRRREPSGLALKPLHGRGAICAPHGRPHSAAVILLLPRLRVATRRRRRPFRLGMFRCPSCTAPGYRMASPLLAAQFPAVK